MTPEQHRKRHELLHDRFDELLSDFMLHNKGQRPSTINAIDLLAWSYRQAKEPTGLIGEVHPAAVCAHCGEAIDDAIAHQCPAEPRS